MKELHPDRQSYEIIWSEVIEQEIKNYERTYMNCIARIPNAKEEIWEKYSELNRYCKINYMKDPEGKIDRHKAAACYVLAIAAIRENNVREIADKLAKKFESGIKTPDSDLVNHGVYLENFSKEIYFAVSEGKISILSLAHELYLLEVLTRVS